MSMVNSKIEQERLTMRKNSSPDFPIGIRAVRSYLLFLHVREHM